MNTIVSALSGEWLSPLLDLFGPRDSSQPPVPWTASKIAKVVGTTAAVGGGAFGVFALYSKLSAVPHTTPAACREFLEGTCIASNFLSAKQAHEAATLIEAEPSMREVCDRMLPLAGFGRLEFCALLLACAEAARLMCALHSGVEAYDILSPRLMGVRSTAIVCALAAFSKRVPIAARDDFKDIEDEMSKAAYWLNVNVRLQTSVELEKRALTPMSLPKIAAPIAT